MYSLLVAVKLLAPYWKDKSMCVRCDNESAVVVCNTGKTKDAFLNLCIRQLWFISTRFNIELQVRHIKGVKNVVADALSCHKFRDLGEVIWEDVSHVLNL